MLKLQYYSIITYFRDKQAVFWTLMFPLIFLTIFRLFDTSGSLNANIIIIDEAQDSTSIQIIETIKSVKGVSIIKFENKEDAISKLKKSEELNFMTFNDGKEVETNERTNMVLYFPKNFLSDSSSIEIYFDETDENQYSPSSIVESIILDIRNQMNLEKSNMTNVFTTSRQGIAVNQIGFYDFFVPGIIGMGIMQSGIIGIATTIATYKEKRILKRLSATPLRSWKFILAQVNTFLVISILQVTIMVFLAKYLLGANIYGSIPLIYFLGIVGSFVFLNLGFITVAMSKTANGAASVSNVFTVPMMFLSGVFFPRESLPSAIKPIADFFPLSPLLDALRAVSLQGAGISDIQNELLLILVWTLLSFFVALKLFKFREE